MSRRADDPILSYRGAGVALAKLRRRPWWMVIVGAAGIVFLLYSFTTFWVSNTDVCWACGATRVHGKTFWIVPTSSSLLETSMSAWLGAHGGHVHTWRFWFGSSSTYRCALGTSPPIQVMRPVMDEFLRKASPARINDLVYVLRKGSEQEQTDACYDACESLYAGPIRIKGYGPPTSEIVRQIQSRQLESSLASKSASR